MFSCKGITKIKGNLIKVKVQGPWLGEYVKIHRSDGMVSSGTIICVDNIFVVIQVFEGTLGLSTDDEVEFTGHAFRFSMSEDILNRQFDGIGRPLDGGPEVLESQEEVFLSSYNPDSRIVPSEIIRTNIPMIDMFNCLIKSQKIPVFSTVGEPYNELLLRVAKQASADVVIVAGLGLKFDVYNMFVESLSQLENVDTVLFAHKALDPVVECLMVPDMALCAASFFAESGKDVLVIMTDMTAFADAIKEVSVMMDILPSNRGYPGSLYSDLASRYEQAVSIKDKGTVTILNATTMPGNDVTHPIPDNTGYITEGQFYLSNGRIEPFGSLSRLKQLVIGHTSREDHGHIANAMIRLYADAILARERLAMGFSLSKYDQRLIEYADTFECDMMDWRLDVSLEDALDNGWLMLAKYFSKEETGIKEQILNAFWKTGDPNSKQTTDESMSVKESA